MQSKLPKPDTRFTVLIPAHGSLPDLKFVYEGEVQGSDIKWNNSLGKIVIKGVDKGEASMNYASCHLGQFTGNCGMKYIAHLNLVPQEKEKKRDLMAIIESFAYHKTNCGGIVGSDTTKPYKGGTITNIQALDMGYEVLPNVKNPNWSHETALFWRDINKTKHTNHWAGGKEEKLS